MLLDDDMMSFRPKPQVQMRIFVIIVVILRILAALFLETFVSGIDRTKKLKYTVLIMISRGQWISVGFCLITVEYDESSN